MAVAIFDLEAGFDFAQHQLSHQVCKTIRDEGSDRMERLDDLDFSSFPPRATCSFEGLKLFTPRV